MFVDDENVPDPYYGGADGFSQVYDMLDDAASDWVAEWKD